MSKIARNTTVCFYPDPASLGKEPQSGVVRILLASVAHRTLPLCSLGHIEGCCSLAHVNTGLYPRAEFVHRFVQTARFAQEGRCRRATKRPIYARDCATVAASYKHSLSCGPRLRMMMQWMRSTSATSELTGGVATKFCKYSGTRAIRFTWGPAWAGLSGCSAKGSTTKVHLSFTTPDASTYSVSPDCGPSIPGDHRKRKAGRLGLRLTSRHGSGRCATLHPRQRTRKNSRPTSTRRAVA